jgi:hypothetical protein
MERTKALIALEEKYRKMSEVEKAEFKSQIGEMYIPTYADALIKHLEESEGRE